MGRWGSCIGLVSNFRASRLAVVAVIAPTMTCVACSARDSKDTAADRGAPDAAANQEPRPVGPSGDSGAPEAAAGSYALPGPEVLLVVPQSVRPGAVVHIAGKGFGVSPVIRLDGHDLIPLQAGDTTISFVVPVDFPVSGCRTEASLQVVTDSQESAPAVLVLEPSLPQVTAFEPTVPRAGEQVTIHGHGFADVVLSIDGQVIAPLSESDHQLTVALPEGLPAGTHDAVLRTPCASVRASMVTRAPRPVVLSVEPSEPQPGGVVLLRTANVPEGTITGVSVGAHRIARGDTTILREASEPGSFLVRVPDEIDGPVDLALETNDDSTESVRINVRTPNGFRPPSAPAINLPPSFASDDGTFPIGTTTPHPVEGSREWVYYLHVSRREPNPCAPAVHHGVITGQELHCEPTIVSDLCRDDYRHRHEFRAEYRIGAAENFVHAVIDRTASGGVVEDYVGGWAGINDAPPSRDAFRLVLTSITTGHQIVVVHDVYDGCP